MGREPTGGWWQDEKGKWRQGGRPGAIPAPVAGESRSVRVPAGIYRVGGGLLLALFGALAGAAASVALTYALLSGEEVDALVWLAGFIFFCFFGMPLGIGLALLLGRLLWPPH
jgi:hypothetical protein